MRVRNDGLAEVNQAWTVTSDERVKRKVKTLSSKRAALMALRPVTFDYIDGATGQTGFIAQEVQSVLPEIVRELDDTGLLGIQETHLIPMLVQVVQELITEIGALNKQHA